MIDLGASPTCLLECPEGTYYLYNELSNFVWKILAPRTVEEIAPKLKNPKWKGLSLQKLEGEKWDVVVEPITIDPGKVTTG